MSLLTLIKAVAEKRMVKNEFKVTRSAVPMNLHQGSAVTFGDLDLVLAQADGSIVPTVESNQTVSAVGTYKLFGFDIYHCYLSDGKTFLRLTAKNNQVHEAHLFVSRDEIIPESKEDWEFWLGKYDRPDPTKPLIFSTGLIGWPQFQVDGTTPVVYNRSWVKSSEGVEPVTYTGTITDSMGNVNRVKHEGMEYGRLLTESSSESLLVSLAQVSGQASVDIFVGIPLNLKDIKVFATK